VGIGEGKDGEDEAMEDREKIAERMLVACPF